MRCEEVILISFPFFPASSNFCLCIICHYTKPICSKRKYPSTRLIIFINYQREVLFLLDSWLVISEFIFLNSQINNSICLWLTYNLANVSVNVFVSIYIVMSLQKRFERKKIPYLSYEIFIGFPKGLLHNSCQYLHHMTNRENRKLLVAMKIRLLLCMQTKNLI